MKHFWMKQPIKLKKVTAWKVSKYGVTSGPYFPVFRPEITPYLDTFHVVSLFDAIMCKSKKPLLLTKDTVIQLWNKEKVDCYWKK